MAEDAPAPTPVTKGEEFPAEAELRVRDIGQRLGTLPHDMDELLRLLVAAEKWLVRLVQKKTRSMVDTLSPIKAVLISRDLLDHPDPDVKLVVTSCLTEIIRLTAPDAPYGDDVMKEVFQRMVGTFADLGDINSPSYERSVLILDCIARVKCCMLMLDLGLDHLILDIFHHIFKAASKNHSKNVIESMEDILRVVIEEIDDIHVELASCLLRNLTKEAQESLPASFRLAERLVYLCKDRLIPVFAQLLRGNPLDNYSNIVTLLCRNTSNVVADAPGTNMSGEGKISERSVSEESPQETSKLEKDVSCPGQDDIHLGTTPTIAISNGGALGDNNKSPDSSASSEQKPAQLSGDERVEQLISVDKEVSESVTSETEKPSAVNSKKSENLGSSTGSETIEHSKVVKDNIIHVAAEAELSPETDHGDNKQITETIKKAADTTPAVIKKRGQPPLAKSQGKKPAITKQESGLKSGKVYPVSDSGRRITRQQSKEDAKSSSTEAASLRCNARMPILTGAAFLGMASLKLGKKDFVSDKDADEDTSLKEMVSATKTDTTKDQQEDVGVSKRELLQEAEAASPKKNKMLDENLVGSRIKVWWPEDKMFYNGVVEWFDASSEKHKVAYDDGDVEILVLKNEIWQFIGEDQDRDPDAASDMPPGRRGEGSSSLKMEGVKTGATQRGSNGGNPPKKRGRPKGSRSRKNMSNTDSLASSARLKGKGVEKDTQETPTPGRRITHSIGKAKDDVVKESNKDEAGSTKSPEELNNKAGSEDNNSNDEIKSSEAVDGSKTNGDSNKRKLKEKEDESLEKSTAKISTGKKRGRKSRD